METSGNKYLHKKFKKQTSCNPVYNTSETDKNDKSVVVNCGVNSDGIDASRSTQPEEEKLSSAPANFLLFNKDNKPIGSVPNYKSTNCDVNRVTESFDSNDPYVIARDLNVVKQLDNQSSISNVAVSVNVATSSSVVTKEQPVVDYSSFNVVSRTLNQTTSSSSMISIPSSCISNVITSTTTNSLLGQEINVVRNFNFDTKVNISESTVEKSSILDTIYSKSSVISNRPNAAGITKTETDEAAMKVANIRTEPDGLHVNVESTPEKKPNYSSESTSGNGKYVCTYCNLACSKPSVLQKHIRAHTNERPYPCVSCGFSFKTRSNLYKHCRSRTHANRVMGNKHVQIGGAHDALDVEGASEKHEERLEYSDEQNHLIDEKSSNDQIIQHTAELRAQEMKDITEISFTNHQKNITEQKSKPYKPRFHTANLFFEENKMKENDAKLDISNVSNNIIVKSPKMIDIENESQTIKTNPDLLKLRINELINKNNSIVNCDDAVVIRRRNVDNIGENINNNEYLPTQQVQWLQQPMEYRNAVDEPLNLTAKNRKRCLSDSENTHKSLIKELLLKNLSADPNLQCKYCKMIFQTVTELEMHTMKYCNAKTGNIRYARSSSVNVASILTQNKNAFDNIPHMQHTTFPLKSPGPFLGKTRLIENDKPGEKYRTFSFDDNVIMHHSQSDSPSFNKYMLHSPVGTFPLSPHVKKNPIKLFGGEVKITQTSGETRSFKIESESINKMSEEPQNFMEFGGSNLSENLVIKSTLQSGGTVLQNKANYSPKIDSLPSPNVIRVYDNNDIASPNLNLPMFNEKPKFSFDKLLAIANNELQFKRRYPPVQDKNEPNYLENARRNMELKIETDQEKEIYKNNLIDFGKNAVKLLAPNLKPPNLTIPGIPIPSSANDRNIPIVTLASLEVTSNLLDREKIMDKQHIENFAKKQISLQQRMAEVSQPQHIYNPMNLLINGKVVRYVPGMPGPIAPDHPNELAFNPLTTANKLTPISKSPKELSKSPTFIEGPREIKEKLEPTTPTLLTPTLNNQFERKTPTIIIDQHELKQQQQIENKSPLHLIQQNKNSPLNTDRIVFRNNERHIESPSKVSPSGTTISSSPEKIVSKEELKKFVRPNSLALKPSSVAFKSHHGLTPTVFNQALISPDTPRVAKKYCQQYLNGNYFSYLGLKSSTKSVYCTLNKTQPFYVKHFKKLSMYSEWRQQESKIDSLSVSAYDSRQRQQKYTLAKITKEDLVAHSSYKFITAENPVPKEETTNKNSVLGGYESNEDYTYIRGRGRGRYVCDQCGIRCKKPSMLKKHIRTHSDDRPYTCEHCNFSFKTKGNLTKHMKSKAHSKKYAATSSTSTQNSNATSSDSDESDAESSDESTRLQDHEAAHCLLSLSQKNAQPTSNTSHELNSSASSSSCTTVSTLNLTEFSNFLKDDKFLKNPDQINQVTNTNFAKNKILDESAANFNASKHLTEMFDGTNSTNSSQDSTSNVSLYLGKSSTIRPLVYPYSQTQLEADKDKLDTRIKNHENNTEYIPKIGENFQNFDNTHLPNQDTQLQRQHVIKQIENNKFINTNRESNIQEIKIKRLEELKQQIVNVNSSQPQVNVSVLRQNDFSTQNVEGNLPANIVFRKRKLSTSSGAQFKYHRSDGSEQLNSKAVDLSVPMIQDSPVLDLSSASVNGETISFNGAFNSDNLNNKLNASISKRTFIVNNENQVNSANIPRTTELNNMVVTNHQIMYNVVNERVSEPPLIVYNSTPKPRHNSFSESNSSETFSQNSDTNDRLIKLVDVQENSMPSEKSNDLYKSNVQMESVRTQSKTPDYNDQDQSAMQTLADIAISQVKLEKNILAKNVASEYLKLALNSDGSNAEENMKKFVSNTKEPSNELIVKPEENKNCTICSKNFSKPSQLRLHMNIHYLERPFRCESCSVSFRTKGHLQKHERSASHHNKLSSSPALSSSEPRPFKCSDCNIAFRIHGHLAKHLRSKMHIMKLECLAKIPFGLYAELERANSLLTEINTTDGDLCLESLKILAKKLFSNDPNKLDQLGNAPDNRNS